MKLTTGTVLHNNKYVLDTQLGQGIFSITYRATDTESGQTVVIKTLAANLRQHPEFNRFKQQFLGLAERFKRCRHPNLVQVVDCFEEAGYPFIVVDYIPGQTLAALLQTAAIPEAKALKYVQQLGGALNVLHKAGLLHRDIRPQNIILRQENHTAVLVELGLTCDLTPGVRQTYANLIRAGYAPPEQYAPERQLTPATDIYALSATFYCLLTGHPPLPAPVRETLLAKGKKHLLFPVQQSTPTLSSTVKQSLWRGLALDAQKRPQTVNTLLARLGQQKQHSAPAPTGVRDAVAQLQTPSKQLPAKPKTSVDLPLIPTVTQRPIPQPPVPKKELRVQPELIQAPVTSIQQSLAVPFSKKHATRWVKLPLKALLMTGALAASAGLGFGFALRINSPTEPGSTILHTKQSFPPRSDWPVSEPRLKF